MRGHEREHGVVSTQVARDGCGATRANCPHGDHGPAGRPGAGRVARRNRLRRLPCRGSSRAERGCREAHRGGDASASERASLPLDSQELAVDSQELAVDSQELAVRTGGCRVGVRNAGCSSLPPWHVLRSVWPPGAGCQNWWMPKGVLDAGCLAGRCSSLLLRQFRWAWTLVHDFVKVNQRAGSRQRIAMCAASRRVMNLQGAGPAPSEPHAKHFRGAARIRARTPLAHHANVIIGSVVRRGRIYAVPVARRSTLTRR